MQRRRFLAQTLKTALGAKAALLLGGLPAVSAWAANHDTAVAARDLETLAVIVRGLLPHDFLTDEDYVGFAQRIDARLGTNPAFRQLITDGIASMNAASGGNWLDANDDDKVRVLETLQDEASFGQFLNAAIDTLYQDPAVYRKLGYEGSAIEFGGYLNRGFDDIDWLPAKD
ncbi:MAG: hypothetical protein JSV45_05910 [Chromatiales bacterium]|nr:MAG: hypothetical protein JSV45_05910 [Chromatiales bacterium]